MQVKNRKPVFVNSKKIVLSDGGRPLQIVFEFLKNILMIVMIGGLATFAGVNLMQVFPFIIKGNASCELILDIATTTPFTFDLIFPILLTSILFGIVFYSPYVIQLERKHTGAFMRLISGAVVLLLYDLYYWKLPFSDLEDISTQQTNVLVSQLFSILIMAIFVILFKKLVSKTAIVQIPTINNVQIEKRVRRVGAFILASLIVVFVILYSNQSSRVSEFYVVEGWISKIIPKVINVSAICSASIAIMICCIFYHIYGEKTTIIEGFLRLLIVFCCLGLFLYTYSVTTNHTAIITLLSQAAISSFLLAPVFRSLA